MRSTWNTAILPAYSNRKLKMQKFLFGILAGVAIAGLAGCASDEAFDQSPGYSPHSLQTTADDAAARDASSHGGFNPGQKPAADQAGSR